MSGFFMHKKLHSLNNMLQRKICLSKRAYSGVIYVKIDQSPYGKVLISAGRQAFSVEVEARR